jgi:hypothetical protein
MDAARSTSRAANFRGTVNHPTYNVAAQHATGRYSVARTLISHPDHVWGLFTPTGILGRHGANVRAPAHRSQSAQRFAARAFWRSQWSAGEEAMKLEEQVTAMSKVGDVTVKEFRIAVCTLCNCMVGDLVGASSCSYDCPADCTKRTSENTIIKVYRRTDELIREDAP